MTCHRMCHNRVFGCVLGCAMLGCVLGCVMLGRCGVLYDVPCWGVF